MTRCELLAPACAPSAPQLRAFSRMDKWRISAITDEIGLSTEEHLFDGTLIQAANASMEEIMRIGNEF